MPIFIRERGRGASPDTPTGGGREHEHFFSIKTGLDFYFLEDLYKKNVFCFVWNRGRHKCVLPAIVRFFCQSCHFPWMLPLDLQVDVRFSALCRGCGG